MTRDLAGLLADTVTETERTLPTELGLEALPGMRRRVLRRRVVRHTIETGGVLAVAAVVAVGAWVGTRHTPAPPAQPTPSVAPSVAPTPAAGALGLPPALVLPDGMLQDSRPGWALQQTRPTYTGDDSDGETADVIDLVSPQGDRYRVLDLPSDAEGQPTLVAWTSGATSALTVGWTDQGTVGLSTLDLLTGSSTPIAGTSTFASTTSSVAADGSVVWVDSGSRTADDGSVSQEPGGLHLLRPGHAPTLVARIDDPSAVGADRTSVDPTSTRVVVNARADGKRLSVYDLATGALTPVTVDATQGVCEVVSWSSATTLLVVCHATASDDGNARRDAALYAVEVDGSLPAGGTTTRVVTMPDEQHVPRGWSGAWVRDGVVAFGAADDYACETGVEIWDGSRFTVAEDLAGADHGSFSAQAAADVVFVDHSPACEGTDASGTWTAHDLSTGTATVLDPGTRDTPPSGTWVSTTAAEVVARN